MDDFQFPILADVDFGHTSPIATIPVGIDVAIDTSLARIEITEASMDFRTEHRSQDAELDL